MVKKSWLNKQKKALKKTFQVVRGRKGELESLAQELPKRLDKLERGLEAVDHDFPIREGHASIDILALHPSGEMVFIWVKRLCNAETISKLLPDYDWIQKNQALWPHLFPQVLENRSLLMKVWIFALEIDPEVQFLLSYLHGIRVQLFHCRGEAAQGWSFTPWETLQKSLVKAPALPSSPTLLQVVPPAEPPKIPVPQKQPTPALLTPEEIQDLIGLSPVEEFRQEDEITDPFYELRRPKNHGDPA